MAAEFMGEAFLSSMFGKLFEKMASPEFLNLFRGLKLNESLLKKLKIMLCSANQLLDDAELKQLTNPNVREWLSELKEAICIAEELLEDIKYETLRHEIETKSESRFKKLKSTLSSSCTTFDQAIEEILDRLKFLVEQKEVLGVRQGVKGRLSQRLSAPLVDKSCVLGRDDDKERIIQLLLSDAISSNRGDKISVIPIVGMGGIGKTTLAQLVYEDSRVKDWFHIRSWVVLSDESDISIITKRILEQITKEKCQTSEDLYQLQCKLNETLSDKRFIFVLDDVWNESYEQWDALASSFRSGAHGSKIIVTTRSDTVAKNLGSVPTHHLQIISDAECWRLFTRHVFKDETSETELHAIGRDIVKKCRGVPLAVKSLAGLLRLVSDPEEWKRIQDNQMWELHLQGNPNNNILPSLWLSYQYLPSHLKRCFAYCSIFPKDYEMDESKKQNIILLWMAEGLLQPGRMSKRIEDVGNEYFQDLVSRSLFQPLSKDKSTILMHDLIHDLAVFVSGEFSFSLDEVAKAKFSSKARHISFSKIDDFENFEGLSKAKSVRSCLRSSMPYWERSSIGRKLEILLSEGGCLRALSLPRCGLRVLFGSIGNLKHLRYLNISNNNDIEEIPNTLCKLYNLQTLRLSYCTKLTQLPTDMGNLVNLRHLHMKAVPLEKMPPKMSNLKDLQTLDIFVVGKIGGSNILELGGLCYLSGKLTILELQNVGVVENVQEPILKNMEYLNELVCSWNLDEKPLHYSRKEREVLDALQPHPNLKRLVIDGYGAETFSSWLGQYSYRNIASVSLQNCNCRLLPPLGQLPSLQSLRISSCNGVERVGAEFYDNGSSTMKPYFRSLKSLEFRSLSEWQEWSFPQGHKDGGCFPSLEHLHIWDCPKLNLCLPDYFPSLKTLKVKGNVQTAVIQGIQRMESSFPSLELLEIEKCPTLATFFLLDNLPSNLKQLHLSSYDNVYQEVIDHPHLVIKGHENATNFPKALLPTTLTSLQLSGLNYLKALNGEGFQHLTFLEELIIKDCKELQCFPREMLPTSLTYLKLRSLPILVDLGKGLQHLQIESCHNLPSKIEFPTSLTSLEISNLPRLEDVGEGFFQHLISLETLSIRLCENLQYYSSLEKENGKGGLQHLISLKKLTIWCCENLQRLLEEGLPTSLTCLEIGGFPKLRELDRMGIHHLNSLKALSIGCCENLECLPEQGLPSSLSFLIIWACPLLEARYQKETGTDWHKISHILDVSVTK